MFRTVNKLVMQCGGGGGGGWGGGPGPPCSFGECGGGGGGGGGSRVSGAPGPLVIIGNVGWGRAKACTRFFLCTLSTTTDSGGLRYSSTMFGERRTRVQV